jgi:hypothetical protein
MELENLFMDFVIYLLMIRSCVLLVDNVIVSKNSSDNLDFFENMSIILYEN